jgi:hypothetical protein
MDAISVLGALHKWGPGESYHFILKHGSEEGPRISTDTFEPLTEKDAHLYTREYQRAMETLTDAQKAHLRQATREVFHTGEAPDWLWEQLKRREERGNFRLPPRLPRGGRSEE